MLPLEVQPVFLKQMKFLRDCISKEAMKRKRRGETEKPTTSADAWWKALEIANAHNLRVAIFYCENVLVRKLTPSNYHEFVNQALLHASWEMKLVLLQYFIKNNTAVVLVPNKDWGYTSALLIDLLRSFKDETHSLFGLSVGTKADMKKLIDKVVGHQHPPSNTGAAYRRKKRQSNENIK